jgi:hypothetical protein
MKEKQELLKDSARGQSWLPEDQDKDQILYAAGAPCTSDTSQS